VKAWELNGFGLDHRVQENSSSLVNSSGLKREPQSERPIARSGQAPMFHEDLAPVPT